MSTRDDLLDLLESHRGEYLSGSEIAAALGVSGTAVWKAVRKLQSEGFSIDAVTNKGYMLTDKDILSDEIVGRYIDMDGPAGRLRYEVFDTVGSTNDICKERAAAGDPGEYAAVSACQTRGRGRRGRDFYSPERTGLYMSILLRPASTTAGEALSLTTIAAVAVSEAIEEVTSTPAGIKWVNDIYIEGRKVCGILTEASLDLESSMLDYAVVGIGINVYTPEGGFPEEIRGIAGSVCGSREACIIPDVRSRIAAAVLSHFMRYYDDPGSYIEEYKRRCFVIGSDIEVIKAGSAPVRARAMGLDDELHLLVRYEDGSEEALSSGEISTRITH